MKIVTVAEMRAIEQASVEHGVSLDQLQRNAAAAIAREITALIEERHRPVLFLAGPGNNGRDALIAGAILAEQGHHVRVYLAPRVASEDVLERLGEAGGIVARHETAGPGFLEDWVRDAECVVDGLLGIGIHGAVREPMAGIIAAADSACRGLGVPVAAVDLPSGIDADTGEVAGPALHATWTLSLGCVKAGLLRFPAAEYVGELRPLEIGLPADTYSHVRLELLDPGEVRRLIPPRPAGAHKGTFGRTLIVAGSASFVGAAYLAGAASARVGSGLVTLAVPEWQRTPLATLLPEATYLPLGDMDGPDATRSNIRAISEVLPACTALAIGPGLGQGDLQRGLVAGVLAAANGLPGLRVVVDADGLNALAGAEGWWEAAGRNLVLTPHPGEMSRLTGLPTSDVNARRWEVALQAAERWGQVVVLKGAHTVIAAPDGRAWVSGVDQPALATGGTGDVLTGLIAGLMAQGADAVDAARAAVWLHLAAAEMALSDSGGDRLLASDLLRVIPRVVRQAIDPT